jgi:micrococcal nuclease
VVGLYHQVLLWRQQQVLGTNDERGFERALVSKAIDGDTIELSDGRKVRYIGVDTPETKHPTKGIECFGQQAAYQNAELVVGKTVQLEKDVNETDRYGRLLRYVWLDGQLINKTLVEQGYAFARSYPPDIKRQTELQAAEQTAQLQNLGLWSSCPASGESDLQQTIDELDTQILGATDASEAATLQPAGCVIKGNISASGKLYHLPSCSSYGATKIDQTKGEKWFCTEEEAVATGWTKVSGC